MATGLPIPRWGDNPVHGTEVADARQMVAAMYHSYGVVKGCEVVTSPTAMTYKVAAGIAVGTRGGSYGAVISSVPAGTVATTAAPASGSRIDVIYAAQHDPSQGDKDGACVLGVAQGAAGASPAKPSIPNGAIELAAYSVPSGITTTAGATLYGYVHQAIPYGASLGRLAHYQNTYDGAAVITPDWFVENTSTVSLPTQRLLELRYARCMSAVDANDPGSIVVEFIVDGVGIIQSEIISTVRWETHQFSHLAEIPSGTHSIAVRNKHQAGGQVYYHYDPAASSATSQFIGMTFDIVDRGGIN